MTYRILFFTLSAIVAIASIANAERPAPPIRDPRTPGFVNAVELPDGEVPPADKNGNFIIGPTHPPAPETIERAGVSRGQVIEFTMSSANSKIYPGIARDAGTFGTVDPNDPAKLVVTTRSGTSSPSISSGAIA